MSRSDSKILYGNIGEMMSGFYIFIQGTKDRNSPVYYLPRDVIETILKEYLKTYEILFKNPSKIYDFRDRTEYYWYNQLGEIHRDSELPAEIIVSKENDHIIHMGWYLNDENIRPSGKISAIGYLSDGRVSYKHWNNGKEQRRSNDLPYELSYNETTNHIRCIFTTRDDELYTVDSIPVSYQWSR